MAASGDGCGVRPCRRSGAGQPDGVLAACARGDQKRCDDEDPYGQRDSDNDDRRLHLVPMARRATALGAAINEAVQVI